MLRNFAIAMNVIIAFAFLGIGLVVAPKFSIAAGKRGAQAARIAGLIFFVACAGTHLELAYHALPTTPEVGEWFYSTHGLIIHAVQGVAGWAFTVLAVRYLNVRIMNRSHYEIVLDERIEQLKAELEDEQADERKTLRHAQRGARDALSRQQRLASKDDATLGLAQMGERDDLNQQQSDERNALRQEQADERDGLERGDDG